MNHGQGMSHFSLRHAGGKFFQFHLQAAVGLS